MTDEDRPAESTPAGLSQGDLSVEQSIVGGFDHESNSVSRPAPAMTPADFGRTLRHPELAQPVTLAYMLGLYAWHGRHHPSQITTLRAARGW